jgi:hypothetical protein
MAKDDKRTLTPRLRFPEFPKGSGWNAHALGDVVRFSSGGTPSKDEASYWNGKGVTSLPALFSVKPGKLLELSYTKNGLFVMLG